MQNKKIIPLHNKNFKFLKLKGPFNKKVDLKFMKKALGDKKINYLKQEIQKQKLKYRFLSKEEREQQILKIFEFLNLDFYQAGPKRKKIWEIGWRQNYKQFLKRGRFIDIVPNYYKRGLVVIKLNNDYILGGDKLFKQKFALIILKYLSNKYFKKYENIFEFGCGPSNNIFALAKMIKKSTNFIGIDWALPSVKILNLLEKRKKKLGFKRHSFKGKRIDFFKKFKDFYVPSDSVCFTYGGLEQLGNKHQNFFDFVYKKNFSLYIHIEAIHESYNTEKLLDYMAKEYEKKRNYFKEFYPKLIKYEKEKKIKILKTKKIIGSHFTDDWNLIVWKKLN